MFFFISIGIRLRTLGQGGVYPWHPVRLQLQRQHRPPQTVPMARGGPTVFPLSRSQKDRGIGSAHGEEKRAKYFIYPAAFF